MAETVADFMLRRLSDWGVERIYGYPGDGINGFLGALSRATDRIEFVQDAFVLENLINQLASTFLRRDQGSADSGNQGGNQEKTPAQEPKK